MAKSQTRQSQDMANQNYNRAVQQGNETQDYLKGMIGPATQKADALGGQIQSTYGGMTGKSGAFDPGDYENLQNDYQKFKSTGGFGDTSGLRSRIGDISAGGGYNGEDVALHGKWEGLGGMGGIDPAQAASIRAGYSQLADTGGISDATADAMRRQAASGVQSVYSTLGANLNKARAVQGGAGGGGETAEMARQMANKQAESITGTNAEIGKLRQTGTIAGLGGASEFEQGAGAAKRAAIQGEQQLSSDVAAGRRAGVAQEQQLDTSEANNRLQAAKAQSDLANNAAMQRIQAAGGLQNLYSSAPGYVTSLVQQIIQSQQTTGQLTAEQAQIMQELAKTPGLFGNIMQGIGAAGQIAGGVGGLITGVTGGKK